MYKHLKTNIMNNPFSLDIKTPCAQNFNSFSSTPNGGFCGSCKKEVIDFTKMNSEDIVNYFKTKETQDTCGRFNNNQLQTYNVKLQKNKRLSFLSGIGLACLSLFSIITAQAQDIKNHTETSGKNPSEIQNSTLEKSFIVKGNVSESSVPLPSANVILEGTTIGTTTDFDGNFEFPQQLKKGDVLIFSYMGMNAQKIVIDDQNSASKIELKVDMKMDSCIIMGKVAVKEVYKSKKD